MNAHSSGRFRGTDHSNPQCRFTPSAKGRKERDCSIATLELDAISSFQIGKDRGEVDSSVALTSFDGKVCLRKKLKHFVALRIEYSHGTFILINLALYRTSEDSGELLVAIPL
ncbi:MAG TPA: hypothetical protein VFF30_19925 [Nitrososphaerales archaeon]|nr:hypothetical protein [Nitrososphaerales archaeon]